MKKLLRLLPVVILLFGVTFAAPSNNANYAREGFTQLNQYRANHGKTQLIWSQDLANCGVVYANKMLNEGFNGHYGAPGHPTTPTSRCAFANLGGVGENLISSIPRLRSPTKAMELWDMSPKHKENMLYDTYKYVGIAAVFDPVKHESRRVQVFAYGPTPTPTPTQTANNFSSITLNSPGLEQTNSDKPNLAYRNIVKMSDAWHGGKKYLRLHLTLDRDIDNGKKHQQLGDIAKKLRNFFQDM